MSVYKAYLGWSNKRGGVEFYERVPGENGRWLEGREQGWGRLLAWKLEDDGFNEGQRCLVIPVGDRFITDEEIDRLAALVGDVIDKETT